MSFAEICNTYVAQTGPREQAAQMREQASRVQTAKLRNLMLQNAIFQFPACGVQFFDVRWRPGDFKRAATGSRVCHAISQARTDLFRGWAAIG